MTTFPLRVCFLAIVVSHACAVPIKCVISCTHKLQFPEARAHISDGCDCANIQVEDRMLLRNAFVRSADNVETATQGTLPTTTDICDYLCSIQLGGDACQCSSPGLPGRKRK